MRLYGLRPKLYFIPAIYIYIYCYIEYSILTGSAKKKKNFHILLFHLLLHSNNQKQIRPIVGGNHRATLRLIPQKYSRI